MTWCDCVGACRGHQNPLDSLPCVTDALKRERQRPTPWDAAFPDDDEPVPGLPFGLAHAAELQQPFCACGHVVSQCDGSRRGCRAAPAAPPAPTGFAAIDAIIEGFKPGELAVVAPRARGRARAPKPPKGSPVRHLDARQQELLAHMVVRDNMAVFALDEHVADWATLKKVMLTLGGTWKRGKPGGFVFPPDVDGAEVVRLAQTTGEIFDPKLVGFFPTPAALADDVVALIHIPDGASVLEPSAGRGALARAVLRAQPTAEVMCYELLEDNVRFLEERGAEPGRLGPPHALGLAVARCDFLSLEPCPAYHAVVMNPPFADGADVEHVTHALGFVKTGGALVAIMSAGVVFRQDRRTTAFRALVAEHGGRFVDNPEGAFLESGTGVRTVTLVIERVTR